MLLSHIIHLILYFKRCPVPIPLFSKIPCFTLQFFLIFVTIGVRDQAVIIAMKINSVLYVGLHNSTT